MKALVLILSSMAVLCQQGFAQAIREQDIAYKIGIVRTIPLNHPTNQLLFGKSTTFVDILLEATFKESINAYHPDTLSNLLSITEFKQRISYPSDSMRQVSYERSTLYLVELTEELVFDKHRSVFVFRPLYLTLFVPAEINYRGIQEAVGTWKFEDCMHLFQHSKMAVSQSLGFGKSKIPFEETFLMKTYYSEIVKIGNSEDAYYDQLYATPMEAFCARKEDEGKIQELVYRLYHP